MGALRDYVARDPKTEKASLVSFPVLKENPYKIDTAATRDIIAQHQPELIILGKSMVLHPEPVAQMRAYIDECRLDCVLMYDVAHVLGLLGPHFQQPFEEGADILTGSTHKTYYGTQRGVIAGNYGREDPRVSFWEAVQRRAFPGSVSNHHLGTMLGLLLAAYEMDYFKDEYQPKVLHNAKAFAQALRDCGLDVAGDPSVSYTETHQVIVKVGFAKGPEVAQRLEDNNIVVNYQATPEEEGFTASGSLRMGVAEMTRFGMETEDFGELAELIRQVIVNGANVKQEVSAFRKRFLGMKYCFAGGQFEAYLSKLHRSI
jgi:aminomethyltransferase